MFPSTRIEWRTTVSARSAVEARPVSWRTRTASTIHECVYGAQVYSRVCIRAQVQNTVRVAQLMRRDPLQGGRALSPTYRKGARSDALWHCCANCRGWPTEGYQESELLAMGAVLCHICRAKLRNGTCCRDAITVPEIEDRLQAAAASSRPLIFR